jgi:hypothetical protein
MRSLVVAVLIVVSVLVGWRVSSGATHQVRTYSAEPPAEESAPASDLLIIDPLPSERSDEPDISPTVVAADPSPSVSQPASSSTSPSTEQTAQDPGFAGHWTSPDWGEHYILVQGTTVKIIYMHDGGRVLGNLIGTSVVGWWTEVPSRQGPDDAGVVEFTMSPINATIDGKWRYGTSGTLRADWDLVWVDDLIPPDVAAEFANDSSFVPRP